MTEPTTDAEATQCFRDEPHGWIAVPEGQVAHRRFGRGPDVLFVHGWPVSGATFRRLLPHLVDHVTCHVLDLPGFGHGQVTSADRLTVDGHVAAVRRAVDHLALTDVAIVGHDSGGLIARHALAGDPRVRSWGLLDTEQPQGLSAPFRRFLRARHLPGFGAGLGRALGARRLRRSPLALGGCFADPALLDGDFDELFLRPIATDPARRAAAVALLRSFDVDKVHQLGALHRQMEQPVQLVWGADDPFFPLAWAREMAAQLPDGRLHVVPGTRLFAHEERPEEVASALLPVLTGPG